MIDLIVAAQLDFETNTEYELIILAKENTTVNPTQQTATTTVTVVITDVNDVAPVLPLITLATVGYNMCSSFSYLMFVPKAFLTNLYPLCDCKNGNDNFIYSYKHEYDCLPSYSYNRYVIFVYFILNHLGIRIYRDRTFCCPARFHRR